MCVGGIDQLTRFPSVNLKRVKFKLHDYSVGVSSKAYDAYCQNRTTSALPGRP